MPIEDIIALIIVVFSLISLIILMYIICIRTVNKETKLKDSQIKLNNIKYEYYKWLLSDTNYNGALEEEHEEF